MSLSNYIFLYIVRLSYGAAIRAILYFSIHDKIPKTFFSIRKADEFKSRQHSALCSNLELHHVSLNLSDQCCQSQDPNIYYLPFEPLTQTNALLMMTPYFEAFYFLHLKFCIVFFFMMFQRIFQAASGKLGLENLPKTNQLKTHVNTGGLISMSQTPFQFSSEL